MNAGHKEILRWIWGRVDWTIALEKIFFLHVKTKRFRFESRFVTTYRIDSDLPIGAGFPCTNPRTSSTSSFQLMVDRVAEFSNEWETLEFNGQVMLTRWGSTNFQRLFKRHVDLCLSPRQSWGQLITLYARFVTTRGYGRNSNPSGLKIVQRDEEFEGEKKNLRH